MPLAHFTPAELPGTIAILCLGICAGILIARRRATTPLMVATATALAGFAALGYAADAREWAQEVKLALDLAFLAGAALLASQALRRA